MTKDSFIFRCDIVDKLSQYNDVQFSKIIKAISNYVRYGEIPNLPVELMVAFNFIKVDIDCDMKKYEEKCERNREIAQQRWENERNKNKDKHNT